MSKKMFCGALCLAAAMAMGLSGAMAADTIARPDGKPADMSKPVQVFILMGQSNMLGMGKVTGEEGSLENAVKNKRNIPTLWMMRATGPCGRTSATCASWSVEVVECSFSTTSG